jgi:succinate-acetate transporter protein
MLILIFAKLGWGIAPDTNSIAIFYLIWGIFTVGIFIGTLKLSRALQFFFLTLAILFFLLTASVLTGNLTVTIIAGYEGIICGASGVYVGLGGVLNDLYDRKIFPV